MGFGVYYPRDGDWKTVGDALAAQTVAALKLLARLLPGSDGGGPKGNRIASLCNWLEGPSLVELWSRLGPLEQAAVAETAWSPDAYFNRAGFRIRHGKDPDFGKPATHWSGIEEPTLLNLFIYGEHMPLDLRDRIRTLAPPPERLTIRSYEEIPDRIEAKPVHRSNGEPRALVEVHAVLRLIETNRVAVTPKTGQVTADARRLIAAVLDGGDFFQMVARARMAKSGFMTLETEGPIRSVAWPNLLAAGGFVRPAAGRLALTVAGGKALDG